MKTREITEADLLAALARHRGEENGVHIARLVAEIRCDFLPDPGAERGCRAAIEALRRRGERICAHPRSGYFMAETAEELDATCEFLFSRAMTSLEQISRMRRVALPDLRGQLRMPV